MEGLGEEAPPLADESLQTQTIRLRRPRILWGGWGAARVSKGGEGR